MKDEFMKESYPVVKEIMEKHCGSEDILSVSFSFNDLVHIKGEIFDSECAINEFRYVNFCNKVTVSRVSFLKKRQGCLSEVMNYLELLAKKYCIDSIIIQCVSSVPMAEWCKKHEYILNESPFCGEPFPLGDSGYFYGDYYKNISI